jgi:hypothetical protein
MMTVSDVDIYLRHRAHRDGRRLRNVGEFLGLILLFGSVGAITWAIRGTDGWGGIDGTIIPGMTWGLLWYCVCLWKGIDARGVPLWLGLGIALGGELGYGQYVSWIQGNFFAAEQTIPIEPWNGYLWFVIAGIGWGAPGGLVLGWALSRRKSFWVWIFRLLIPFLCGMAAWLAVQARPEWFFPHYELGIYSGIVHAHQERTIDTNTQNFVVLCAWVGAMLTAAFQRDKATFVTGLVIGGGFGIGFALAAVWCLGFTYAPDYIDWWKVWELNAGFFLGALYAVVLHLALRRFDKSHDIGASEDEMTFESPGRFGHILRGLSLLTSLLILLWIAWHGATYRLGVLLEWYRPEDLGQYDWVPARYYLYFPVLAIILLFGLVQLLAILFRRRPWGLDTGRVTRHMLELVALLGFIGAVTIWPSKVGVLYALLLAIAISSFVRVGHRYHAMACPDEPEVER